MTTINSTHLLTDSISDGLRNGFRTIGELAGRAVQVFKNIPQHMQNNRNAAIGVFTVANAVFITVAHLFTNWLDRKIGKTDTEDAKGLILTGLVYGGSVFTFNVIVSKITHYPLSWYAYSAITVTAIAVRVILNHQDNSNDDDDDEINPGKLPVNGEGETKIRENEKVGVDSDVEIDNDTKSDEKTLSEAKKKEKQLTAEKEKLAKESKENEKILADAKKKKIEKAAEDEKLAAVFNEYEKTVADAKKEEIRLTAEREQLAKATKENEKRKMMLRKKR